MSDNDYVHQGWVKRFEELDRQIVQEAILCQIRILDAGVIERVLQKANWSAAQKILALSKSRARWP